MSRLVDFESKDFVEQVAILGSIDHTKEQDLIPRIISLLEKIPPHEAVVLVMKDTLKNLFSGSEEYTTRYLRTPNRDILKLCIEVAGKNRFPSALPELRLIAEQACEKKDRKILFDVISALSQVQPESSIELFRRFVDHEDSPISSLCIEILGSLNDPVTFERMRGIIAQSQSDSHNGLCDLPTASAIRALSTFTGNEAVDYFISQLHHSNPGVRRQIHFELSRKGLDAVDALSRVFQTQDIDSKIFAANILGQIGTKEAAEALVAALDKHRSAHPNIRYALYEALGGASSMSGLVCLADGLAESDPMVLLAVVSSLDARLNPWILDRITQMIRQGNDHGRLLVKAIIASGSTNIFKGLYGTDDAIGRMLIDEIKRFSSGEQIQSYIRILSGIASERAQSDMSLLEGLATREEGVRILAVDDSKAMLNFYRSVAASLGMGITTALNGREALDILQSGEQFALIITDMNMPVMDGVEFTRHVREDPACSSVPIIMITTESERSQQDLAKKAGVDHFMQKPFDAQRLQEKISSCLSGA